MSVLFGLRKDLVRREKELAMAMAEGMDWAAAKPAMEKIKAERTQTEQRIAEAVRESPLPPTIGDDSVRKWWEETVLENRIAVALVAIPVWQFPTREYRLCSLVITCLPLRFLRTALDITELLLLLTGICCSARRFLGNLWTPRVSWHCVGHSIVRMENSVTKRLWVI
ncbi:hypothetical protein FYJ24_00665 [Actinomycetaceae bacterium WB03_NA08]|uniref:Uncharacterized protein n=1 Tax=Scrofimicrobium canadense TaxID=2652290 RepID=A0A6N7VQQ5_9ACTO|nr:hypothetical protein [Scrofimicrobium canadense]MSS83300.1 hypothetical protein [Scrofimicrobium canadense]